MKLQLRKLPKLAEKCVGLIIQENPNKTYEHLIEPTCGKGNFIVAALAQIKSLRNITGIEIYQPYVWETKFNILSYCLANNLKHVPEIEIIHSNIFSFDFRQLKSASENLVTLVIGNPPWVTNSELGSISSENLPRKSNFKKNRK
ncbi:MAG: hypothetical protein K9G67_12720 [Bacteroidales bacterium]|nr:hypothetical protein [Bacteroidales bacterium]MCF8351424.1 hypothetical protein [Bacteroidales bacterium]MCF8377213.1 hypothetical protein [Bacteroidales bacterium]MCF8401084.1 hypothetical protein [Bacteroidales bacterium]